MHIHSLSGANITTEITAIREKANKAVKRLSELGNWPSYFDGKKSVMDRIPIPGGHAPGFDAVVACALDLIPRDKQRLSAILHAAYTEEAVEQVRREIKNLDSDSETCWWLAAGSLCDEKWGNADTLANQLIMFVALAEDPKARLAAAKKMLEQMLNGFANMRGIPFATRDGGLQGAYLAGYDWGVQYVDSYGLFFIGTFRESLGLENFPFSDWVDSEGRSMSGPVHGSRQFVRVSSFDELGHAVAAVEKRLGKP